MKGDIYFILQ